MSHIKQGQAMANIFLRGWNWACRFRHRCGYGVHSPSDFFLITFVIYERMPFYAYDELHEARKRTGHLPHYREKVDRFLLRLVNYLQPDNLLEIGTGSGISALYMSRGRREMPIVTVDTEKKKEVEELLGEEPQVLYRECRLADLGTFLESERNVSLIHIAHTGCYEEAFERLIPFFGPDTCLVVANPYQTKEKRLWWKRVVADSRTGVTFDLYDVGLVFFDHSRIKEHRIINFL